jgi:hypothetical protein
VEALLLKLAAWLGTFLAPIIKPIVMEALNEWFKDKTFISKPNPGAQSMFDDLLRDSRIHDSAGNSDNKPAGDKGRDTSGS